MKYEVREIPFAELPLIRPLFRQVFTTDLSEAMLFWKYGEGRGRSYGVFTVAGDLLAHCGIFYRQVLAEGTPCRLAQLGDLMALPGRYGGVSRSRSPFALLVQKVLADLPDEQNPAALAFGFPSDRAMRLGERLGLFSSIDRMWELRCRPLSAATRTDRCVELDPGTREFETCIDQVWGMMAHDLGRDLVGVRDARYLRQRYFNHPHHRYQCHLVQSRWLRRPLGIVITRCEGEQCELLDLVASRPDVERLLTAVRQQLTAWGASVLTLWLTERHAALVRDQAEATYPLEFRIMANPFSSGGKPERFADRWWLTGGDTDYR